jgi:hypothetical protein
MQPDKPSNGYILFVAEGQIPEPEWPELTMMEYLALSFKDQVITNEDHPFIKSLKGLQ